MTTPQTPTPARKRAAQWSNDAQEDWTKRTWDVRTSSGDVVESLDALAVVLGKSREAAAADLMRWPSGGSAPTALRKEAEDVLAGNAPGGEPERGSFDMPGLAGIADRSHLASDVPAPPKPPATAPPAPKAPQPVPVEALADPEVQPEVKRGDAVTWPGGTGRVDLIVQRGIVPGVAGDPVHGKSGQPAVRVVLPTGEKVAVKAAQVTVIDPRPHVEVEGKGANGLVTLVSAYQGAEQPGTPSWAKVTGTAVKAAFARGRASWPGEEITALGRDDWALGRVKAFLTLLTAPDKAPAGYTRDHDLLPLAHPARQHGGR